MLVLALAFAPVFAFDEEGAAGGAAAPGAEKAGAALLLGKGGKGPKPVVVEEAAPW